MPGADVVDAEVVGRQPGEAAIALLAPTGTAADTLRAGNTDTLSSVWTTSVRTSRARAGGRNELSAVDR